MTVVFLIGSLKIGGTEKNLVMVINSIIKIPGIKVYPILYGSNNLLVKQISTPVIDLTPRNKFNNKFQNTISSIISLIKARLLVAKFQPDRIASFGEVWNNYALLLSTGFDSNIIIADRGDYYYRWPKFHRLLRKLLYPKASKLILQRTFQIEIYGRFFETHKIRIVRNNFDSSKIIESHDDQRKNQIVCVSRFIPTKGVDAVLRVFNESVVKSNYELLIIGDDDLGFNLKSDFIKFINENNLQQNVRFLPPNTNVLSCLRFSKAFLFGSRSEGMPNVLIEALFSGNHVFTFEDFLELGDESISTYHVCKDENQMALKLDQLLTNNNLLAIQNNEKEYLSREFDTMALMNSIIIEG